MRRTIVNIALLIIAFAIQTCILPFIPFMSSSPNLLLVLVFSYGFIYGRREGMIYGLIAGILMDLFYSSAFGFFSLLFIWVGYLNGYLSKYYYDDYITLPLALCAANEFFYNSAIYVFRFLIRGKLDYLFYFKTIILPEIMVTILFTLIFYRIFLIYNRKLEAIDNKRG